MSAYNTSSAYDFTIFETLPQKEEKQVPLHIVKSRTKGVIESIFNIRSVATFMLVVMVMSLVVYNKTCLNEVNGEIHALAAEIEQIKSDNTRLSSMIESTMSLSNVAEMAQNMGMQKLDKYQIEYVTLYKENKIEVIESAVEPTLGEQVKMMVNEAFRHIKEYLGAA